jgi:hypothetical protein
MIRPGFPRRQRWCAVAFAVAVPAFLVLAVFSLVAIDNLNPWQLVVLEALLDHPFVWLVAGLVSVVFAVMAATRDARVQFGAYLAALIMAMGAVHVQAQASTIFADPSPPVHHRSPDGRFDVVVAPDFWFQGPTWRITVQTNDGLLSRWHLIGCMNGDNPDYALDGVIWTGPTTVRIAQGDGTTYDIPLAPDSGRPQRTINEGRIC